MALFAPYAALRAYSARVCKFLSNAHYFPKAVAPFISIISIIVCQLHDKLVFFGEGKRAFFLSSENPNCLFDRFGGKYILIVWVNFFYHRLSLQVQERAPIGTALACVQKGFAA